MFCRLKKIIALLSAVTIVAAMFVCTGIGTAALEGKGTKSNPYLIKTAAQLQAMSENLSAVYKLANTIDLSGMDFKPIGYLAKPFTGTFTCDLNSDGTPKYIIKNLSVTVNGVEGYADYIEKNSHWEAGLFGDIKGATLTGIAVIDFTIKNTVEGKNQMNPDYSNNPGQDEMAAGGLVAISTKSTITNCIAVGKIVESKNNWCGGLIGELNGGNTVSSCYAQVTIQTSGLWCHGAFAGGSRSGDKITNCMASGDLTAAALSKEYTTGGFVGQNGATIENCYSTASVCAGGSSFAGGTSAAIKNCYATGKVSGASAAPSASEDQNITNCYILNEAGCSQNGFTPASAAEILSKLGSVSGWQASGSLPTIAGMTVITDFSKYVPEAVAEEPTASDSPAGEGTTSEAASSETESAVSVSLDDFKFLDDIKGAKSITVEQAYKILELKSALIEMSTEERAALGDYVKKISDYSDQATLLVVSDFTERVDALPEAKKVKSADVKNIKELYSLYESFPNDVKSAFTSATTEKLEACYKQALKLEEGGDATQSSGMTVSEKVIVIVLLSLSVLALAGAVVLMILNIKILKKEKAANEFAEDAEEEVSVE